MLARRGASVIEAADGATALEALRTEPDRIDPVVLDITLPWTLRKSSWKRFA
jgi:CheY-like chemotaxis protein